MEQHPPWDHGPGLNRLRALWAEGRCALGAIATIPSAQVVAPTPERANAMVARGYRALVVGFDWSLLQRGCAAAVEGMSR